MGAATAERLAQLGATVVALARRKDRLEDVVKNIEAAGGTAPALAADVTDRAAVQDAAHQPSHPAAARRTRPENGPRRHHRTRHGDDAVRA
jgi:NADP-dependent 3-hydroxy acid dehydrogenase YdfG